ncbi:MAG: 3-ketoacyl-ACP reductase [Bacteroidetes bacterium]|nr:3-ketoacyl-ACP reductase [Bacteroidota bacterium]MDA1121274.1 3-ketoacyl-ACP reductase [Bacteroidota bacterium]
MKKVALVTGGSRGIGFGIAKHLAMTGFDLAINGVRKADKVTNELDELREFGVDIIYCQGDIASENDRQSIVSEVRGHFRKLNVLVNNAGIAPPERNDILKATESSFDKVISTNLKGTYFLTQAVANWMVEQKSADKEFQASIVNVTSISSTLASTNRGEYCISKAGLSMASQLFSVRLAEYDIPVFEVRPGIIHTDMTSGVKEKYDKLIDEGLTLQKRWGLPDDVGKAVVSLVSGCFPYSTGQVIMVDGGLTIPRL